MAVGSTSITTGIRISATDRFGFTVFISMVINAVIILGIGFTGLDDFLDEMSPTLEITLVPTESDETPEDADFYAQRNQIGGGDKEEKLAPQTPNPSMMSTSDESGSPFVMREIQAQPEPEKNTQELLTSMDSKLKVESRQQEPDKTPEVKTPVVAELVARSKEIARLSADLSEKMQAYAKRPRRTYLTAAHAKAYKYASYIADWERKIERIGKLNFPDQARRQQLEGNLLLDVAVYANGTIAEINLRRSSGHKVLDDAAIQIVRLAAPFGDFPKDIQSDTDILHITRTWQFLPKGELSTH